MYVPPPAAEIGAGPSHSLQSNEDEDVVLADSFQGSELNEGDGSGENGGGENSRVDGDGEDAPEGIDLRGENNMISGGENIRQGVPGLLPGPNEVRPNFQILLLYRLMQTWAGRDFG